MKKTIAKYAYTLPFFVDMFSTINSTDPNDCLKPSGLVVYRYLSRPCHLYAKAHSVD